MRRLYFEVRINERDPSQIVTYLQSQGHGGRGVSIMPIFEKSEVGEWRAESTRLQTAVNASLEFVNSSNQFVRKKGMFIPVEYRFHWR